MNRVCLFIALFAGLIVFHSCRTSQPAVYPDPVIGDAEFDYWIHSPLHPDTKQEVAFKTKVKDKEGIKKIELWLYEFELYENGDGIPSKRRRIDSQWGLVYDWEFDGLQTEASVNFMFARGFPAFSNVEYVFRVYNSKGEMSERLALFDAGESRWPLDKITLYATTRTPLVNSINLCLFPDVDYNQDWRGFLGDMEKMIYDGFHQNNKIKDHKKNWQFYYTQREANGLAISKDFYEEKVFPSFIKNAEIQGIDAYGLMHKEPYSDGAYLKNNIHFLTYNLFTAESYNYGTAIHEAAHAIFNLSDEYDLCACFEHPEGANVFSSLKGCQEFNAENGFPIKDCTPLEHLNGQNWYMSEPTVLFANKNECEAFNVENGYDKSACEKFIDHDGTVYYRAWEGLCIMQDDGDHIVRDFKRTCSKVIDDYYERLNENPWISLSAGLEEDIDNIFGYEPVVLMELINQEDQLSFKVKGIKNGVPKKSIAKRDAIQLDFLKSSGQKMYSIALPDPSSLHIHKGEEADEIVDLEKVNYLFSVPYSEDLQTMICAQHPPINDRFTPKGKPIDLVEITRLNLFESLKQIQNIESKKD
jgi:hypothetical protein